MVEELALMPANGGAGENSHLDIGGMGQRAVRSPELLFTECHRRHQCWLMWKLFAFFFKEDTLTCPAAILHQKSLDAEYFVSQ